LAVRTNAAATATAVSSFFIWIWIWIMRLLVVCLSLHPEVKPYRTALNG
jgi:hypothetical protein